jgi:hypothetical protein
MDAWRFPAGTKLWKEFTRDGVRVETRLLHKAGAGEDDWVALSYVWDHDGRDASAAPLGLENARGTRHDVPPARTCMGCHGGVPGRVLGFAAIQLAPAAHDGGMSMERLVHDDRLTTPPPLSLRVPGDPTTQRALRYLHANCSHCHNQHRPPNSGPRCFDPRKVFDLSLRVDQLATPESTPVYRTAIGRIITPANADSSPLFQRFLHGPIFGSRMPALGTETVNEGAAQLLRTWIEGM